MIVYKRKLKREDITGLEDCEQLIYYKSESIAVTINQIEDFYIAAKRWISNDEPIEDFQAYSIDEILEFALS